jgi:threonine dehydrogenase-like Zn-dependent dehydrogenase
MLGAERVITIDRMSERLQMAKNSGATVLNDEEIEVGEALKEMTGGRGPDSVIDAVGMESSSIRKIVVSKSSSSQVRSSNDRSRTGQSN